MILAMIFKIPVMKFRVQMMVISVFCLVLILTESNIMSEQELPQINRSWGGRFRKPRLDPVFHHLK